jgi:hypothetical protein
MHVLILLLFISFIGFFGVGATILNLFSKGAQYGKKEER